MKKLFIIFAVVIFMFSSLAYAEGGRGSGSRGNSFSRTNGSGTYYQSRIQNQFLKGNAYKGSTGKGTLNQSRIQTQKSSEKGSVESKGSRDTTRTKIQKRDESCE